MSQAASAAPEGGGGRGVPRSRAVTEGGTGQLGKAEIKDGPCPGLWNQLGLGSVPGLPLTGCVTMSKSRTSLSLCVLTHEIRAVRWTLQRGCGN